MFFSKVVAATFFAFCLPSAHAKDKAAEKVLVLDNIPTTTSYDWWVEGQGSISCSGTNCEAYFMPASAGVAHVSGAVLKLQRQDGTIVIAECTRKERVGADLMTAMVGVSASDTFRSCRIPDANQREKIEAEFHTASVKLSFLNPSSDPSGKIFSETYIIKGFLQPTVPDALINAFGFESENNDKRDSVCGPVDSKLKLHIEKDQHPLTAPDKVQARIYLIQEDKLTVWLIGGFPTRFGLDGRWIGGGRNDSYVSYAVDPGEHNLCAEWQLNFSHHVRPLSLAKFNAQAGETYFFRARVTFAGFEGERSIHLEPLSDDEGRLLVARSALSVTNKN